MSQKLTCMSQNDTNSCSAIYVSYSWPEFSLNLSRRINSSSSWKYIEMYLLANFQQHALQAIESKEMCILVIELMDLPRVIYKS